MDYKLLLKVNRFLKFQSGSRAAAHMKSTYHVFDNLTPQLKKEVQISVLLPPLKSVRMFGWDPSDVADEKKTKIVFNRIDADASDAIDEQEMSLLFAHLEQGSLGGKDPKCCQKRFDQCFKKKASLDEAGEDEEKEDDDEEQIEVTDAHRAKAAGAMTEIDTDGGGEVSYDEFRHWWYLKSEKQPCLPQAPIEFMEHALAAMVDTECFSPGDIIVEEGTYGDTFFVLFNGTVWVQEKEEKCTPNMIKQIKDTDRQRVFGIIGALPINQQQVIRSVKSTTGWYAKAADDRYCDVCYLNCYTLRILIRQYWPRILEAETNYLWETCRYYYNVENNPDCPFETEGIEESPVEYNVSKNFFTRELDRRSRNLEVLSDVVGDWQTKLAGCDKTMLKIGERYEMEYEKDEKEGKIVGGDAPTESKHDVGKSKNTDKTGSSSTEATSSSSGTNSSGTNSSSSSSGSSASGGSSTSGGSTSSSSSSSGNKSEKFDEKPLIAPQDSQSTSTVDADDNFPSKSFMTHTPDMPGSPQSICSLIPDSKNDGGFQSDSEFDVNI